LFSVCHDMSIPITTVLPAPLAIFSAMRKRSGFPPVSFASRSSLTIQASPYFVATSAT
jgi:hypothetical protein